jgi:hypothetical protein
MNQLIEKFIAESTICQGHPQIDGSYFDKEKFAELIVRECANHCDLLLDHKMSSEWSRGTHDCSKAIKKHFGVEE